MKRGVVQNLFFFPTHLQKSDTSSPIKYYSIHFSVFTFLKYFLFLTPLKKLEEVDGVESRRIQYFSPLRFFSVELRTLQVFSPLLIAGCCF